LKTKFSPIFMILNKLFSIIIFNIELYKILIKWDKHIYLTKHKMYFLKNCLWIITDYYHNYLCIQTDPGLVPDFSARIYTTSLLLATWCYSRIEAEDAYSLTEAPIDLTPIKTEDSEILYCIHTSICTTDVVCQRT